ncbi:MAG: hypothetical protein AAF958_13580 [Planctomycetota bacterium]
MQDFESEPMYREAISENPPVVRPLRQLPRPAMSGAEWRFKAAIGAMLGVELLGCPLLLLFVLGGLGETAGKASSNRQFWLEHPLWMLALLLAIAIPSAWAFTRLMPRFAPNPIQRVDLRIDARKVGPASGSDRKR